MNFNFGNLSETSFSSTSAPRLKPYGIYPVKLKSIEKTELKGSKDPNAVYPVVSIEFINPEDKSTFSTNLFIPTTEEDLKRPVFQNKEGHDYERPSRFENFQFILMQIVEALNKEGADKIKANGSKIKTIDQFIDLVIKALSNNNGETKLKLVGRNNNGTVYADLPRACGINKSGDLFPVNFIGENLFFTNYELQQQKEYQTAKATPMPSLSVESSDDNDDFLDSIEL